MPELSAFTRKGAMPGKNLVFWAILLILVTGSATTCLAQQKPVLTSPIDDSDRVTVTGSRHPLAQPQFDAGTLDPGTKLDRMFLVIRNSPQQQADLEKFLESQQDRTSPNYHHWLTPDEFGQKFGPAPQDIAAVRTWLAQQGFTVGTTARSGLWIEFSGTAGQAERAFQTLLRHYDVPQGSHIANATEISLPAAMAPVVQGVLSLHNFFKKPTMGRYVQATFNGNGTYSPVNPDATFNTQNGPVHALTPGDYANIYQLNPLYSSPTPQNGKGVTIAIVARSGVSGQDFADFRSLTGLPPGILTETLTLPPDPGFDRVTGDGVEASLDVQWAGGIAPGAAINIVVSESTATTDGVDLSSAYIVDHNLAPIMNVSFGACESDLGVAENAFFSNLWQQAAAEGISVMVSSGDSGAAGCDFLVQPTAAKGGPSVSGLASTPFNTAVGGTQFQESGNDALFWNSTNTSAGVSAKGYIPEVAWNETCDPTLANSPCASIGFILASGGGGASALYPKPAWQVGVIGGPNDAARDVPDISLSAASHDGYIICFNSSCGSGFVGIVGGTSASSPAFAGVMAIINQAAGRQGLPNFRLYELAQQPNVFCSAATRTNPSAPPPPSCIFNDVTFGSNGVPGQAGFSAGAGYDRATGLGSINAANLVTAWKSIALASTSVAISSSAGSTITAQHGQAVPLTVNVTGASSTGIPSGAVALSSSTAGQVGAVALLPSPGNVGSFNGTISNLPGGTYTLNGHYPGDQQFAASDSNGVSVSISPEASSTTLRVFGVSSTGSPVAAATFPYGSFMVMHADVAGASGQGSPTGTVTFLDAGAPQSLGTSGLNLKAESELLVTGAFNNFPQALTIGTHTLSASYGGDSSFTSGSSAPLVVTITKGNPIVDASTFSQKSFIVTVPGTINGTVQPRGNILPTGTVQYFDGTAPLGQPVQIPAGSDQAPMSTTFDIEGQHSITASYSGDATYNASVSAPFVVSVGPPFSFGGANSTSLSATVKAGQAATYNIVGVGVPTFSGTVTLTCSSPDPGVTCSASPASIVLSANQAVPFTVTASTSLTAGLRDPLWHWPFALAGVVALALAGVNRKVKPVFGVVVLALMLGSVSCGGGGGGQPGPTPTPTPAPQTHTTVVLTGTSGTHVSTLTMNLTVVH